MDHSPQNRARPVPGRASRPSTSRADYEHRTTVNLMAVIAILLLAAGLYWTVNRISDARKLERCVTSGRRDCFVVPDASPNVVPPARTVF